jgi:hypothetical protein
MNTTYLAAVRRSLTAAASRRSVFGVLTAGLLAAGPLVRLVDDSEARKRGKRRKKRQDRKPNIREDASCSGSFQSNLFADGSPRFAQTFRANATGPLVSVELLVIKTPGTVGDWVLRLAPVDASGFPTNEVLAETSVLDEQVPDDESVVTFTFSEPATVRARGPYALVVTRPDATSLGLGGQLDADCAIQAFTSPDQTSAFDQDRPDFDFIFTAFVRSKKT